MNYQICIKTNIDRNDVGSTMMNQMPCIQFLLSQMPHIQILLSHMPSGKTFFLKQILAKFKTNITKIS